MAFYAVNPYIEQSIWANIPSFLVSTPAGEISTSNINGTLTVDGGGISVNDFSDIIQIQYVNTFADLQTALTNLSGFGGGKVIIAEGTYTITATLTIPANVVVEGSGIGATILQADTNLNAPIFQINNVNNVIIKDLTLDGNASNQSSAFNVLDITGTSSRIVVAQCNLTGSFDNTSFLIGIASTASIIIVRDCLVSQAVAPASAGSGILAGGTEILLQGNTFTSNFSPFQMGASSSFVNAKGNTIQTFGDPITVLTGATNCLIEGNTIEDQTASTSMVSIQTGTVRIQVLNNILRTSADTGIVVAGTATQILIEGNSITDTVNDTIDISTLTDPFTAITKNNAQQDLIDPATINGANDRVLVETTTATATVLSDLNTDSAGHKIYIELDVDAGDLTLTATSPSGFSSITFDDAGDWVILKWIGNAWEIESSNGVIIDTTIIQPQQQIEYSLENLNYDGTTIQDFPSSTITLEQGDHLVNYSVAFTTSDTSNVVNVFFRDADTNTIIDESKTIFNDSVNTGRQNVSKQFVYTVANPTQSLKLSYLLSGGTATTEAVELNLPGSGSAPNFDQAPVISTFLLDALPFQEASYAGADINYTGTTTQTVPSTITIGNGTWLMGYSLALRCPSSGDGVSVFVEDTGSTVITDSKTIITESTTTSRHTVSKYFLYVNGAGATTFRIGFRTDTLADVGPAVEISPIGSLVSPNQTVNLWAIDVSTLTSTQDVYTTLTDLNYNNSNYVDVPINITLSTSGDYLVGYSLALRCPQTEIDPVLVAMRDNTSDEVFALSKTFFTDNSTTSRQTISKAFLYRKTSSTSETLKLSFALQNIADTSPALEMTPFTGITNPDQVPVLWAIRFADVPTPSELGTTFLDLTDTPNTYSGFSGRAVVVNPAETGLTYGDFFGSQVIDPSNITASVVSFPAGFPATITVSNPTSMRIGSIYDFSITFLVNTPTTPTNPLDLTYTFEFNIPGVSTFNAPFDVQATANGYSYTNFGTILTTNFVVNNLVVFADPFSGNVRCSYNHSGGTSGIVHNITVKLRYQN